MAESTFYTLEKKGPIAWIWLDRPDKKNAMGPDAWWDAPAVLEEVDADPEIRVAIVAGKGACFSAGIDLVGMAGSIPELMEEQKGGVKWRFLPTIRKMQETMTCFERCRKPVIAAIHGHCIGAGLDMATACDIRLASQDATFCLKEAAVAFVADVGVLQRIPLICGQGVARELAYTAKSITAARAREVLLVSEVYPDPETLLAEAEKMALEIAENSPLAVQASKEVMNFGMGRTVDEGLKYVASISTNIVPSDDLMEAVTAFMEKRKPVYTGK